MASDQLYDHAADFIFRSEEASTPSRRKRLKRLAAQFKELAAEREIEEGCGRPAAA
jgi:hypothetical protein